MMDEIIMKIIRIIKMFDCCQAPPSVRGYLAQYGVLPRAFFGFRAIGTFHVIFKYRGTVFYFSVRWFKRSSRHAI